MLWVFERREEMTREFDGKVVESLEKGERYFIIYFTDGSRIEIEARGSEEFWIEVTENN